MSVPIKKRLAAICCAAVLVLPVLGAVGCDERTKQNIKDEATREAVRQLMRSGSGSK